MSLETIQAVESYLLKGSNGQLGSAGEGTILENPKGKQFNKILMKINRHSQIYIKEVTQTKSADNAVKGITISAARYASEDASVLVHYSIALIEYSKICLPYKASKEKVELIKQQQAEYERKKHELDLEVSSFLYS